MKQLSIDFGKNPSKETSWGVRNEKSFNYAMTTWENAKFVMSCESLWNSLKIHSKGTRATPLFAV